ncbi:MAG: hypothetical protein IT329_21305 [Caldilineaceae bacterium]|nr:hypothetical protein [Caldilineaceae bacterium]
MTILPRGSQAATDQALVNGSFEGDFVNQPGCRRRSDVYETNVGAGWTCFTNRGAARYGFYADTWSPVVADGQVSQLIEINTWGLEHGDNDRYAGIYQTVPTVAGAEYRLSLRGMIRTTNLDGDPWRYRVQVGYLPGTARDWREVTNWTDVGWDTYYPRTQPGAFSDYQTILRPDSNQTTLFIRVWKKWGLTNEELNVNLDAITLVNLGVPPSNGEKTPRPLDSPSAIR